MSTATMNARQQTVAAPSAPVDDASILDLVLDQTAPPVCREVEKRLRKSIRRLEELLPTSLKPHAAQLAKRALLTFSRNRKLQECTPDSFLLCVLQAAEYGLAVDGRLAHAVPYWNKQKNCNEAQFQADYKGIITAAKSKGVIRNACGAVVYEGDHFEHGQYDHGPHLEHSWDLTGERKNKLGVWAKVVFPDGTWDYTVATMQDIHRIRDRGKCRDRQGNLTGPWLTDEDAMAVKTVLKRLLKTAGLGPDIGGLLDHDDPEDERPAQRTPPTRQQQASQELRQNSVDTPPAEPTITPSTPAAEAFDEPALSPWQQATQAKIDAARTWDATAVAFNEIAGRLPMAGEDHPELPDTLMALEYWTEKVARRAAATKDAATAQKLLAAALALIEGQEERIPADLFDGLRQAIQSAYADVRDRPAAGQMFSEPPDNRAQAK